MKRHALPVIILLAVVVLSAATVAAQSRNGAHEATLASPELAPMDEAIDRIATGDGSCVATLDVLIGLPTSEDLAPLARAGRGVEVGGRVAGTTSEVLAGTGGELISANDQEIWIMKDGVAIQMRNVGRLSDGADVWTPASRVHSC